MQRRNQEIEPEQPYRILVVDDEEPIREFLKQTLEKKYQVYSASHVREAQRMLAKIPGIQVVISDYSMPGDDGITFMCELRKKHPRIQRIMLTGFTDKEVMLRAINEARLFHFIVKPARKAEILQIVDNAIHEHDQLTEIDDMVEDVLRLRKMHRSFIYRFRKRIRLLASLLHLPEHPAIEPLLLFGMVALAVLFGILIIQLLIRFFQ